MENLLTKYIKKSISESKISHAFLVETNDSEETMKKIHKIFVETGASENISIENNPSILIIRPENNLIDKNKILQLQKFVILKAQNQKYKLYFILNANYMNVIAANKLLKTLEEPSENVIGFLLTSSTNEIMDTIKSRCIHFNDYTSETSLEDYSKIINCLENVDLFDYIEVLKLKKEILSYDKNNIIKILEQYQNQIISNPHLPSLAKKYKIIDNIIIQIKANVNVELCLDKMFIEMRK